jgi:hypothetical protein
MKTRKYKPEAKMDYKAFVDIHMRQFNKELEPHRSEIKMKWFDAYEDYEAIVEQERQACIEIKRRKDEFLHNAKHLYKQYLRGEYEI